MQELRLMHDHPFHARHQLRRSRQTIRGSWRISGSGSTLNSITISPASKRDVDEGLLAYLAIEIDRLVRIDGVGLRLTEEGRLALSFPTRTSRRGTKQALLRPVNSAARTAIERTIFEALGIKEAVQQ
jgi:DNA-binding cell septation regulator SpoVG